MRSNGTHMVEVTGQGEIDSPPAHWLAKLAAMVPPGVEPDQFLHYIRQQHCDVCEFLYTRWSRVEAHHVLARGSRWRKSHFGNVVPLCWAHHREWHQQGQASFCKQHGYDPLLQARYHFFRWLNTDPEPLPF